MNSAKQANRLFLMLVLLHIGLSFGLALWPYPVTLSFYGNIFLSEAVLMVPALFVWKACGGRRERIMGEGGIKISSALLTVLVTGLFLPLMSFLNALSMLFVKSATAANMQNVAEKSFFVNLFFIALLPAVCEEFVFRGALYGTYRRFGVRKAIVLSAFLFGCLHLNFNQFVYTVAAGFLFVLIMEGTGSIFYSMLAHFIMNGNSVFLTALVKWRGQTEALSAAQSMNIQELYGNMTWFIYAVYGVVTIAASMLGVLAYTALVKNSGRDSYMKALFKGELPASRERVFSPVLAIGILVCAAFMVYVEFYR